MRGIVRVVVALVVAAGGLAVVGGGTAQAATPVAYVQRTPVVDVVNGIQDDLAVLGCASSTRCWVASSAATPGSGSPSFGNLSFAALTGTTLAAPVPVPGGSHTYVSAFACSTSAYCAGVGLSSSGAAQLVVLDAGVASAPVTIAGISSLAAVDCVARTCTAVGARFNAGSVEPVLVRIVDGVLQGLVSVGIPANDVAFHNSTASAVDCVAATTCVVAGSTQGTDGWVTPVTGSTSGPSARTIKEHGNNGNLGLACAAVDSCVLTGEGTQLYSGGALGARLGTPTGAPGGTGYFSDVTCVGGVHACLAAEGQLRPLTDGVPGAAVVVSPDAKLLSVDCFAEGCVGLEAHFDGTTHADPIAVLTGFTVTGASTDTTAPTATITAPTTGAELLGRQVLAAGWSCADEAAGSGIASCTGTVDGQALAAGAPLPTTAAGAHTVTVTARDRAGNQGTATASYSVLAGSASVAVTGGETVSTGATATPAVPVQTSVVVPAGVAGQLAIRPQATPGSEAAPAGVSLLPHQVVLSGPAATAAAPHRTTFTLDASDLGGAAPADVELVQAGARAPGCSGPTAAAPDPCVADRAAAADGSGDAVVTVRSSSLGTWSFGVPAPLAVTTTSLLDAVPAKPYSAQLAATGGIAPYTWAVAAGALPAGLVLSPSGLLSGTPTGSGPSSFTVRVTDAAAAGHTATRALSIEVRAIAVGTAALPDARVQKAYTTKLAAIGGTGTLTWTVVGGALPAGLKLATNGTLSGTPTATGSATFTVQVADAATPAKHTDTAVLTLTVAPMVVVTTSQPDGLVGKAYAGKVVADGGKATLVWTATGLPPGVKLSTAGALSGTPTAAGTFSAAVHVHDATKPTAFAADGTVTITVAPMTIATASAPSGLVGKAIANTTLKTLGGKATFTWTVAAGALPPGLKLSTGGVLSGTPTVAGTYAFTVQVTDGTVPKAVATRVFTTTVAPMSVTTTALPDGHLKKAYSGKLVVAGGKSPYVWTVAGGALPPGIKLATSGTLSGTPTAVGSYPLTVTVTDTGNPRNTASASLTIAVGA